MKSSLIALLLLCSTFLSAGAVNFTLRNNSLSSIPLKIPGVMNPNLSPMSNSGVDLKEGQKIYFFHKKKKYLLLEVTEDYENKTIIVNVIISQRKEELGLKKSSRSR